MALTKKQKEVHDYILAYHTENGFAPTQNEIRDYFGLRSLGSVQKYIQYLHKEGLLKNHWNQRRGLEVQKIQEIQITKNNYESIPLLGLVAAGNPILALENPSETFLVPRSYLKAQHRHFALEVKGDSMIEAGILEGDTVVCRSSSEAKNGEVVVAVINGEATLKTFSYPEKNKIVLLPANKNYAPIIINETIEDFKIVGTLVALFRTY